MRHLMLLLPLFAMACDVDPLADTSDPDDTSNPGDTHDDNFNTWSGADNYGPAPSRAPDEVIWGNLSDGATLSDLSWGESGTIACWAAPAASYTGAHDFQTIAQSSERDLYVRLTPAQGLDMSLYVMQRSPGSSTLPPNATVAGGGSCDGAYDSNGNASQPEVACVAAFTDYTYSVLIGVAGAAGLTSGEYKLEIWDNDYSGCVHPDG